MLFTKEKVNEVKTGNFVDDGGITIDYGHHINVSEGQDPTNSDHKLLA